MGIPLLCKLFLPIPAWLVIVCSVFGSVGIARVFYSSEKKAAAK